MNLIMSKLQTTDLVGGFEKLGQRLLTMSVAFVSPNVHLLDSDFAILLFFDIFLDNFTVDSNGTHKVPPSPHVHAPITFAKLRKLFPQPLSAFALQNLHYVRGGKLRWH